jgi:hypothetical protein
MSSSGNILTFLSDSFTTKLLIFAKYPWSGDKSASGETEYRFKVFRICATEELPPRVPPQIRSCKNWKFKFRLTNLIRKTILDETCSQLIVVQARGSILYKSYHYSAKKLGALADSSQPSSSRRDRSNIFDPNLDPALTVLPGHKSEIVEDK